MKVTERGWVGHFICGDKCLFRRNTLITHKGEGVVVSTVGAMRDHEGKIDTIGAFGRYYETMVFPAKQCGPYIEAETSNELSFESEWSICADSVEELPEDVDNQANDMHEAVVKEFKDKLRAET